ncbi:hypothetical protein LCGC14_1777860 [marine sediment metagenome]|uniref:Uncharacterized protein n=1 Tax=marine sediment metagenome TaxID=412755 RepID=A0A0F9JB68_9ZZZZ|nr:hypothetical protein [Porticoccus sp.]
MSVKKIVCDECKEKMTHRQPQFKDHGWAGISPCEVLVKFTVNHNTRNELDICDACAIKAIKKTAKELK